MLSFLVIYFKSPQVCTLIFFVEYGNIHDYCMEKNSDTRIRLVNVICIWHPVNRIKYVVFYWPKDLDVYIVLFCAFKVNNKMKGILFDEVFLDIAQTGLVSNNTFTNLILTFIKIIWILDIWGFAYLLCKMLSH